MVANDLCGKCDEVGASNKCSCDDVFCDTCFPRHLQRLPNHRKTGGRRERAWKWAIGAVGHIAEIGRLDKIFEKDEGAKWFGLHVENNGRMRTARIIETPRFNQLIETSAHASADSPQRQFPSLVSFVGETGAGKSTVSEYPLTLEREFILLTRL